MYSGKTGEIKALDFRERAPMKAKRNMYLDAQGKVIPHASINGYLAVATPGTIGMYELHRHYGNYLEELVNQLKPLQKTVILSMIA